MGTTRRPGIWVDAPNEKQEEDESTTKDVAMASEDGGEPA